MILKSCLEAIVRLTEHHTVEGLTEHLVALINRLVPARAVAVYELFSPEPGRDRFQAPPGELMLRNLTDRTAPPRRLAEEEALERCYLHEELVVVEYHHDSGQRVVYPVRGLGTVTGLLVLDADLALGEDLEYLDYLIRIYSNHRMVLDKKERDALTGLLNRQSFDERVANAVRFYDPAHRRRHPSENFSALAVLDIDFFKRVNDRFGHLYGDEVLLLFAHLMEATFRFSDLLFRYGGEEFVVLLSNVTRDEARHVLERFRTVVEDYPFPKVGQVTVSTGFVELVPGELPSVVVDKADRALYYAKEHGRNRVCSYDELLAAGELSPEQPEEGEIELF